MKTILLAILMIVCLGATGQTVTDSTISEKKISYFVTCRFTKTTVNDSSYYSCIIQYEDGRYPALHDISFLTLYSQNEVDSLIINLNILKPKVGGSVVYLISTSRYTVAASNTNKFIMLENERGQYTNITVAQADKLIAWLKTVKFSK